MSSNYLFVLYYLTGSSIYLNNYLPQSEPDLEHSTDNNYSPDSDDFRSSCRSVSDYYQ